MALLMLTCMLVMTHAFRGRAPWSRSWHEHDTRANPPSPASSEQDRDAGVETVRQRFLAGEITQGEYEKTLEILLGLPSKRTGDATPKPEKTPSPLSG
jgi:hypothetical protein